ncbi:MAG: glycine dehydrogenase [Flavobacteriaceae bacterium CG_4_8_14_3_um_filter_34_10]|nr:glycine dehydrogenase [Flavobacteriia bacterium]OIP51953.1 MAG: hypothetical protein AUK33_02505 [Flavobacteriaceae bacterium CG2_30_34_30]PIQ18886.1 MAG: glycine dehydrogenase [Flavobacteriaceae bacterium CG18_big_fil_WC_8_21_14_2_50_34_36]PIV48642.1 MAG: glycine dehydrogenase [Flavobacteriaceae bacterium CG02_land_8_20_14_3_00_34_13]PIX08317.1 MAG: glycine dehydrogenase [Flavobacteriaceae bacterium CG_4_8_14_3_um_filter_34_10]PIZ08437.1 MAG: glycine dehydrogenase [Flavobacteriaceae bacter
MKKNNTFFISCDTAQQQCDKVQYKEATLYEKFTLKLHLLFCNFCKLYTKKNTKLTELIHQGHIHSIPSENKSKMKSLLEKEISK